MKHRASKLDPFAEQLTEMLLGQNEGGKGLTYAQAQEQLRLDGCVVSTTRLCDWWQRQSSERLQDKLLRGISTGAQQVKSVNEAFAENPAPGMETIANLHRLLAFQLATRGAANPELLELSTKCTKMVLDYAKVKQKREELNLNERRFQRETCELFLKWADDQKASQIAASSGSNSEKIEQLGQMMFGESWKS